MTAATTFAPLGGPQPAFLPPLRSGQAPSSRTRDAELVVACRAGSAGAFREIYARHASYVARITARVLGSEADLDDVVQDTFVDAHRSLHTLTDGGALRGWLVAVAVRKARRVLAGQRRRRFLSALFGDVTPRATDARLATSAHELCDALDRIDPDLRIPWVLVRACEMSLEEAARACDVSLATIKRRVGLAEERLQKRLSGEVSS